MKGSDLKNKKGTNIMPKVREIQYGKIKQYTSFNGIQQWIIRNLMTYGNCCFKVNKFLRSKEAFEFLFGKRNMVIEETEKQCIIMSINSKAQDRARKFVLV